jgi:hypothetical protein
MVLFRFLHGDNLPRGISVQSDLIIKLLNGNERYGILNQEFDPASAHIDFFCTTNQRSEILALGEICYIKFLGKPDLADSFNEDEFFEDVTTLTGDRFHLRLKKSGKRVSRDSTVIRLKLTVTSS